MEGLFDITDNSLVSSDKLLFTDKGEKKRVCIRDPKIAVVEVHIVLKDKRRRLELCLRSSSRGCKYCDKGFVPSRRFCVRVFEYFTKDSKTTLRLVPWVFGQDKMDALRKALPKGRSLKGSEWLLSCTNPTFQSFSVKLLQECLLQKDKNLGVLASTLSKKVKADGLAVLKALVTPAVPTESSQSRYSQNQYNRQQGGSQSQAPPPSGISSSSSSTQDPLSELNDLVEFGGAEGSGESSESLDIPPTSEEFQEVEGQEEGAQKGEALESWEKDLDDILGGM